MISEIAAQLGMDGVIRFRERFECIYTGDGDILKLFVPQSQRPIGGRPGSLILLGNVGFVLRGEVPQAVGNRKWLPRPDSLSLCPLVNFPWLIRHSAFVEGKVRSEFAGHLHRILNALPRSVEDIERSFGKDFLRCSLTERIVVIARFVRQTRNDIQEPAP